MKRFASSVLAGMGIALLSSLGVAAPQDAADRPAAVVKYRQSVMKGLGNHMSAMSAVVKGEVSYTDQLAVHASGVDALGQLIPTLFPPGTGPDRVKSQAKEEIWTDSDAFRTAFDAMRAQSARLVAAAKASDIEAFKLQYASMGKACGACHDGFRVKEE